MDIDKLVAQLTSNEGYRRFPYLDTKGKTTIGVGRNLTDKGISKDEGRMLLQNDIAEAVAAARTEPWWAIVADDDVRARAMVDLVFNMGIGKLRTFVHALSALAGGDFNSAADQFVDSAWYREVGIRGPKIVGMIRTGQDTV